MFRRHYLRLVRGSALYDLVVAAGFATPWTFHTAVNLIGKVSSPPGFDSTHVLFANLMGSTVVVWSLLRLVRAEPIYGLYDSVVRGLFLAWQFSYLPAMQGASAVWVFAVFEAAFGATQAYGYWILRKFEIEAPIRCRVVPAPRAAAPVRCAGSIQRDSPVSPSR